MIEIVSIVDAPEPGPHRVYVTVRHRGVLASRVFTWQGGTKPVIMSDGKGRERVISKPGQYGEFGVLWVRNFYRDFASHLRRASAVRRG